MQLRVMLVEDHAILRDVLIDYVARLPQVHSCTAQPTAEAALTKLRELNGEKSPDLLLIDLSLPGMSGIELIREIKRSRPGMRCAILSGHRSASYAAEAMAAGAKGYLLKGDPHEIERGIHAIFKGERYVSSGLLEEH